MKNKITETTFNYDYTGIDFSEKELIAKGFLKLSGEVLHSRINNMFILGDYIMGYKFATELYEDGTVVGINDVSSEDFGHWHIDYDANTLKLVWNKAWINTLTHAYDVNGAIVFFDVDTGNWRTTFKIFKMLD